MAALVTIEYLLSGRPSESNHQTVVNGGAVQDIHAALNYTMTPASLALGFHTLARCHPPEP